MSQTKNPSTSLRMTNENLNDIVFENRNKNYGAYTIRRDYDTNIAKAFFITTGAFLSLVFVAMLFYKPITNLKPKRPDNNTTVFISPFTFPDDNPKQDEQKKEQKKEKKENVKKSDDLTTKTEVKDDAKEKEKDLENDKQKKIDKDNKNTGTDAGDNKEKGGKGNGDLGLGIEKDKTIEPVLMPDSMPEFPGGIKKLMEYLGNNIRYPEKAKDREVQGTVFLTFIVSETGEISNVSLAKDSEGHSKTIGAGCEDAAMDVVKAMPKWKPGKNKGVPVKVLYNLPVKFKLRGE